MKSKVHVTRRWTASRGRWRGRRRRRYDGPEDFDAAESESPFGAGDKDAKVAAGEGTADRLPLIVAGWVLPARARHSVDRYAEAVEPIRAAVGTVEDLDARDRVGGAQVDLPPRVGRP